MNGILALRVLSKGVRATLCSQRQLKPRLLYPVVRKLSFFPSGKKNAVDVKEKTEYEIEVEKFNKKENYTTYYGFVKGQPFLDYAAAHMLCFFMMTLILGFMPFIALYGPDFRGNMRAWRRREAVLLIEQREAAGEMLINPDFVPKELIADMVPPPGEWEERWLRDQPAVRYNSRPKWYVTTP